MDKQVKDWSKAGPKVPNQEGLFIGFFAGRWSFLLTKQGGPVNGQTSLEHALLVARCTPETADAAARLHKTSDIRYGFKTGRCAERADWAQIRDQLLWEMLLEKYGVAPDSDNDERRLNRLGLIETAPAYLEDGNVSCENWLGNCRCPKCERELGVNMHGRYLMAIRTKLIENMSK